MSAARRERAQSTEAKPALMNTINKKIEERKMDELNFIQKNPHLRQAFSRPQGKRNNFYPRVKDVNDMEADDVQKLQEDGLTDIMRKLIQREKQLD